MYRYFLVFFIVFLSVSELKAQRSFVWVKVLDSESRESLAYATVTLLPTGEVQLANENGLFGLHFSNLADSILVSHIGYGIYRKPLHELKGLKDTISILLNPYISVLSDVYITPPDPDKILETALDKYIERNKADYCSKIALRGTVQVNNNYKQWVEAAGEGMFYFKSNSTDNPQTFLFESNFDTAIAAGVELSKEIGFVTNTLYTYALAIFPWNSNYYQKKIKYSMQDGDNAMDLIQITLTPNSSEVKKLRTLDKFFGFLGDNSPALFEGVNRVYWINMLDTTFVSIELISTSIQSAKLDHNKRKYFYRRYYYTFHNSANGGKFSNAFATLKYMLPKSGDIFLNQSEIYFQRECTCPKQADEFARRFGIITMGNDRTNWYWDESKKYKTWENKFFGLYMKNPIYREQLPINLPAFVYRNKALSDLECTPGIDKFTK